VIYFFLDQIYFDNHNPLQQRVLTICINI